MPIGLGGMLWAEEQEVARQRVVAAEAGMMVDAASRTVGVEEVMQARPGLAASGAFRVRSCRLMKRRQGTYRSRLVRTVLPVPPYAHQTL